MTREEAIETLKANYPDACYEQLREAVDTAIEALKAQDTAGDTIYRKVAIDAVQGIGRLATLQDNDAVVRMSAVEYVLFNLPSAQPERKTGKWRLRLVDSGFNADWHCSECGWKTSLEEHGYNFCPNCGADMRGEGGK